LLENRGKDTADVVLIWAKNQLQCQNRPRLPGVRKPSLNRLVALISKRSGEPRRK